jgi:predicted alpha/beta superfamily hydrolase
MLGVGAQSPTRPRTVVGDLRVHEDFESKNLGNRHALRVWLPPGYEAEGKRRYPVLYLGDGQNLFNLETSYLPDQEWRVDEIATMLIEAELIEPIIVVGVDNAGRDRANEYLPTRVDGNGGRVDRFGKFLVEEVKPFIDRTYRTKPGAADTALGGSSFGGIMTLCVGLAHPKTFGKLAILSPSVWWDNRRVLKDVEALPRKTGQRIWIDIGTREGTGSVPNAKALHEAFAKKGWRSGRDLAQLVVSGAEHNERAWAGRMDAILLWFFRKR